jgi:hypothetical protein
VLLPHYLVKGARAHPDGQGAARPLLRPARRRRGEPAPAGAGEVVFLVVGVDTE